MKALLVIPDLVSWLMKISIPCDNQVVKLNLIKNIGTGNPGKNLTK